MSVSVSMSMRGAPLSQEDGIRERLYAASKGRFAVDTCKYVTYVHKDRFYVRFR